MPSFMLTLATGKIRGIQWLSPIFHPVAALDTEEACSFLRPPYLPSNHFLFSESPQIGRNGHGSYGCGSQGRLLQRWPNAFTSIPLSTVAEGKASMFHLCPSWTISPRVWEVCFFLRTLLNPQGTPEGLT